MRLLALTHNGTVLSSFMSSAGGYFRPLIAPLLNPQLPTGHPLMLTSVPYSRSRNLHLALKLHDDRSAMPKLLCIKRDHCASVANTSYVTPYPHLNRTSCLF